MSDGGQGRRTHAGSRQGSSFNLPGLGLRTNVPVQNVCDEDCKERIGTGPPRARTEVIYVDLGYWLDPPKRGSGLLGNKPTSVQKELTLTETEAGVEVVSDGGQGRRTHHRLAGFVSRAVCIFINEGRIACGRCLGLVGRSATGHSHRDNNLRMKESASRQVFGTCRKEGKAAAEQKMLKGHLPRVIHHQAY